MRGAGATVVAILAVSALAAFGHGIPRRYVARAKLVARGAGWSEGASVALSADGRTALFGAPEADASFVFVRLGSGWRQQARLVGTGELGGEPALQGTSVALSGNGDIALVGGPRDDGAGGPDECAGVGATWVFVRHGSVWRQQAKLVGSGGGDAGQGLSVALSADGTTALIGGPGGSVPGCVGTGETWVFVHSGPRWHQQARLVAQGGNGEGSSVAISGNGNEALIGRTGAGTFVFTRAGAAWGEPATLVDPAGGPGVPEGGVALSGDGRTALIGGWVFAQTGGAWRRQAPVGAGFSEALSGRGTTALLGGPEGDTRVYTRSSSGWHQMGSKLVAGSENRFGSSAALSADGSTALLGGSFAGAGAAWVFSLL